MYDLVVENQEFQDSPLGKIPKDWDVVSIGDIAVYVGSGITPRGGSNVYKKDGIVFIRSQNVTFNGLILNDIAYIDVRTHESMKRSEVFAHDVLLNLTGASIGRCCPVPEGLGTTNVNQHVCAIRLPNPNREDAIFLSSVLQSHIGQSQIDRLNAGGNREGLNYPQLRAIFIPSPSPKERACIVEILEKVDNAIAHTDSLISKLKQIKAGLLHDLLTRGLDENGQLRNPEAHPEQFQDTPLGRIPKDWEAKPLAAIADLQVGFAFKSEWFQEHNGIKLLRGENVGYGSPNWDETRTLPWNMYPNYREYELFSGDIIIGMDRTFTKSGFKISILTHSDVPALLVQRVGRFLPINCDQQFLKALLNSYQYHVALLAQQKGMDIPHLSKSEILEPIVLIPPIEEQSYIAAIINKHETRICKEEAYLNKLKLQKQGLMQDLLTGKVRVKN